ncbi:hypothetical protein FB45DRAFT_361725 [Roridomyces roridus]|uniref:F-box domain-containing protein n=1 Tax=Roridomyces roridus TaxID=1738132 RepID=A0AAD7FT71_9AGAR|nr:hypothetical protein FB45DRAFT_361725 [Roridomyces roridus]
MAELPVELFHAILDQLKNDLHTLFKLRLVSKPINELLTPWLFDMIMVWGASVKGAELFRYCGDSVRRAVRMMYIAVGEGPVPGNPNQEPAALVAASRLSGLTSLEDLRLDFAGDWGKKQLDTCMYLKVFETLANSHPPPSLTSLGLINVRAAPDSLYSREDFLTIFRPLKKLEIAANSGDYEDQLDEETFPDPGRVEFWDKSLPNVIRSATALTSLTLRTDHWVGGFPALSFKDVFLPQLTEFVLQRFMFEPAIPDYDIVQFVIRHKDTLTRLDFQHCTIGSSHGGDGGQHDLVWQRPWHAVFTAFAVELGKLTEFAYVAFSEDSSDEEEEENDSEEEGARFLYSVLLVEGGYKIVENEDAAERDRVTLEDLQRLVRARKS